MDALLSILQTEAEALGFTWRKGWCDDFMSNNTEYHATFQCPHPDQVQKNVSFILSYRRPMEIHLMVNGSGGWRSQPFTEYPAELDYLSNEQKHFLNWCSYCLSKMTADTDIDALIQKAKGKFCSPPSVKSANKII